INGTDGVSPLSMDVELMYLVHSDSARPSPIPPNQVSGRFENPPIAAAPNASTISSVSVVESRGTLGASSRPDSVAEKHPMIQAHRRTLTGLIELRLINPGLSTTARIATPSRVARRKTYSSTVNASETANITT